MSKKILIGIGIAVVIIALLVGIYFIYIYKPAIQEKKQLIERFSEFESQYQEKKAQGYDVSEAEEFARKAKQAFERKDYKTANGFLDEAFEALKKAKIPSITPIPSIPIPDTVKEEAKKRLSQVKVASLYSRVNDGAVIGRSVDDVIRILNETQTDYIYRGFWKGRLWPEESPETASPADARAGYTISQTEDAIKQIKRAMPNIIFSGDLPAYELRPGEKNALTGEVYTEDDILEKEMWFNPTKLGLSDQPDEFWIEKQRKRGYFTPDITNQEFQNLLLSWAKKLIDMGVDAIWIDMLFAQTKRVYGFTHDWNHPQIKAAYDAASKIVDEIHNYSYSKYGKYIYVGTWSGFHKFSDYSPDYSIPDIDFVTISISSEEVESMQFREEWWDNQIAEIRKKLGNNYPIFVFLDFAGSVHNPLGVFSQELTPEQQREFLREADAFFSKKGVVFIYPIHGGTMGKGAKRLSFGSSLVYDGLAPEFQTYEAMKQLAQNKSKVR